MLYDSLDAIYESAARLSSLDFASNRPNLAALDVYLEPDDKGFVTPPYRIRSAHSKERRLFSESANETDYATEEPETSNEVDRFAEVSRLLCAATALNEICALPHVDDRIAALERQREESRRVLEEQHEELAKLDADATALANAEALLAETQANLEQEIQEDEAETLKLTTTLEQKRKNLDIMKGFQANSVGVKIDIFADTEAHEKALEAAQTEVKLLDSELERAQRELSEIQQELEITQEEARSAGYLAALQTSGQNLESANEIYSNFELPNSIYSKIMHQYRLDITTESEDSKLPVSLVSEECQCAIEKQCTELLEQVVEELQQCVIAEKAVEIAHRANARLVEAAASATEGDSAIGLTPTATAFAKAVGLLLKDGNVPVPQLKQILASGTAGADDGARQLYTLVANGLVVIDHKIGSAGIVRLNT